MNKILKIMLFAVLSISLLASCDKKNTEPNKTPEQIAQENLAEFKAFFGKDGIKSIHENYVRADVMKKLSEYSEDEKQALEFHEDPDSWTILKIKDNDLVFDNMNISIDISSGTIEKKESRIYFTAFNADLVNMLKPTESIKGDIICIIDIKTKQVDFALFTTVIGAGWWDKFNTKPYVPSKSSETTITRTISTRDYDSFNGRRLVYVKLQTAQFPAMLMFGLMKPYGFHEVLFTTENGVTRVQFCGPNGELSGNDYFHETTHHFWKNRMPMALNFENVSFRYNASNGEITPGNGVIAHARRNHSPKGLFPHLLKNKVEQDSGSEATIIKTEGNTPNHFLLDVKLDFEIDAHCLISDEVIE